MPLKIKCGEAKATMTVTEVLKYLGMSPKTLFDACEKTVMTHSKEEHSAEIAISEVVGYEDRFVGEMFARMRDELHKTFPAVRVSRRRYTGIDFDVYSNGEYLATFAKADDAINFADDVAIENNLPCAVYNSSNKLIHLADAMKVGTEVIPF